MPVEVGEGGLPEEARKSRAHVGRLLRAEVVALTTEAAMLALDAGQEVVTLLDLHRAAKDIRPQITPTMLDFYSRFGETVT